jgi:cytochrome c-type biogenesis protein CcmH/NrfF
MRQELHELVEQGLSHDAIIAHFIKEYGSQEVLSAPIDTGFNRLLWIFPYALGFVGVVSVGGMAVSWSRRRAKTSDAPAAHTATFDPGLQERLDDELRDLD